LTPISSRLKYIRVLDQPEKVAEVVANILRQEDHRRLLAIHGGHGARLCAQLQERLGWDDSAFRSLSCSGDGQAVVEQMLEGLGQPPPLVLGVGGGATLDVAKICAHRLERPFLSIPTLVSHDGIASPIAVLRDASGRRQSLGASAPFGVVVSLALIAEAPLASIRAGIGDLVSNLSALPDWFLAIRRGREAGHDLAALLAEQAALSVYRIERIETTYLRRRELIQQLVTGLILSGLAMDIAGTSRPCSGAEHLISHAIDQLERPATFHGEQVALGTLYATYLRGGDWRAVADFNSKVGLPLTPADLGLDQARMTRAIQFAPQTRPERYTILSETDLSDAALAAMFRELHRHTIG
jgi:glycerol-1-phosphate dehydrogenase [NAD(P)+]